MSTNQSTQNALSEVENLIINVIISTNLASNNNGDDCHLASSVVTIDLELLDLHDRILAFDNRINTVATKISEI